MPQAGGALEVSPALLEANTENFFSNRLEPQCGQGVPFQSDERTSNSLSCPQLWQANS